METQPVLLPGKSHERRRLVSFSQWGRKESDTTERFHFHFSLSYLYLYFNCYGDDDNGDNTCLGLIVCQALF